MEAAKRKPAGITRRAKQSESPGAGKSAKRTTQGLTTTRASLVSASDSITRPPKKKGGFCMKENQMKTRLMEAYSRQDWKGIVETMAQNPGDKGDIISMLDNFAENADYEESGAAGYENC